MTETEKIINWRNLSDLLTGEKNKVRPGRVNKKHAKIIDSLRIHLEEWAKENNIKEI